MNAPQAPSQANVGSGTSTTSGIGDQARGLADDAKKSAEAFAEERKTQGAERLQGVADTVERVADQVAEESPAMADWVRKAAHGLDDVSRNVKDKSVGELLGMAKDFANREPAAFIAASAVAGFAMSRLLKSSASGATGYGSGPASNQTTYGSEPLQPAKSTMTPPPPAALKPSTPDPIHGSSAASAPKPASTITPVTPKPSTPDATTVGGGSSAAFKTNAGDPAI